MKKNSFRGRLHFLLGFFNAGKSKWHKSCNKVLRVGFVTPWLNQGHSLKQELFSGRLEFLTLILSKVLGMKTDEREIDMNKIMKRVVSKGWIILLIFLGACETLPAKRVTLNDIDPPKWVLKGGGAYKDSGGKAFYGVGSATGIKNFSLQRVAADDRARNDLAKVFEFLTKSLVKDYMAHTTAGDFTKSTEEQNVEGVIRTVTAATLTGVMIIDHWEHPHRNELFALATLNLEKFKQNIDRHKELSKEVRDAVKENAEKLHEELEQEVLKMEGGIG